jgi:hypothetical protein
MLSKRDIMTLNKLTKYSCKQDKPLNSKNFKPLDKLEKCSYNQNKPVDNDQSKKIVGYISGIGYVYDNQEVIFPRQLIH